MTTVDDSQPNYKNKQCNSLKYIYFDFECMQDNQMQCDKGYRPNNNNKCSNCRKSTCGTFARVPNLCVAHKMCDACLDRPITLTSTCDHCGPNERVFSGPDTTSLFCRWLFLEENFGATVI